MEKRREKMKGVGRFNEVSTSDGAAADNDGIGFRVCGEWGALIVGTG